MSNKQIKATQLLHIDAYPESIEIGDRIQGVNGLFSTFKVDDYGKIQKGSTINITEDEAKSIKIINKNNNVETTKIDDLEYIINYGAINYEAIYAISPKGTIAKKGTKHILQTKSQYVILEGLDFSKYEGQNLAIAGIIDAGNINNRARRKRYICHKPRIQKHRRNESCRRTSRHWCNIHTS